MLIHKIGSQNLHGHLPKPQNLVPPENTGQISFENILRKNLEKPKLQYSKHVNIKMKSLGIEMNENLKNQLEEATDKARQKNIREGLILTDEYGFVVSVKNNTVITVVNLKDMQDNVFTNIDGAVIV